MDSGGYHYADLEKITFNSGSVEDTIPPGKINDLDVTVGAVPTEIILDWTAPGDDNYNGTASEYTIKYSSDLIDQSNWSIASSWEPTPIPSSSGTPENTTIQGLASSQNTYFAVMTTDEAGNDSEISNNAILTSTDVDDNGNPIIPDRISLNIPHHGYDDTACRDGPVFWVRFWCFFSQLLTSHVDRFGVPLSNERAR